LIVEKKCRKFVRETKLGVAGVSSRWLLLPCENTNETFSVWGVSPELIN
jgi:hypothetical protein